MRKFAVLAAVAALSACSQEQAAEAPADNEVVVENDATAEAAATPSTMETLAGTSWEFTRDGKQYFESIDENGNYIANNADGSHADHGTLAMKDGKACFTSAMNDEGEDCWTVQETAVGETVTTTSDSGETLQVTRVEYRPLSMPS